MDSEDIEISSTASDGAPMAMDIAAALTGNVDVNIDYAVPILGTITFGGIIEFEVTIQAVGAFNCGIQLYGLGLAAIEDKDKHYVRRVARRLARSRRAD